MKKFLKNTISLVTNVISRKPNYLILFVTSKCNSRCKTCCNWKNIENSERREEISIKEIYKIAQNFPHLQYLTISGGEPFLRQDLSKIITIFTRISNVQIVNISTNGSMPSRINSIISQILLKNPNIQLNIDISIDEIEEKHDYIRGFPANYERIKETYKSLKEMGDSFPNLIIRSSTVISSYNQHNISEILDWIQKKYRFDFPTFSLIRGAPQCIESLDVNPENYLHLVSNAIKIMESKTSKNILDLLIRKVKILGWQFIAQIYIQNKMPITCYAGKKMLVIDDVGEVFPCEILNESFGNLRENKFDLKKMMNQPKVKSILKDIKNHKCSCTFECAIQNSVVNNPRLYYLILKNIKLQEILRLK